jgi:transposase
MEQESSPRRKYDREFKYEVLRLVKEGNKSIAEIARDLGIDENLIYIWRKKAAQDSQFAFPGKGHLKPQDEELRRLKRQLMDVTEERDILKKALAIFSRAPKKNIGS